MRSNHTYINFDDLPFLYNAKARLRILGLLQWPPSLQCHELFLTVKVVVTAAFLLCRAVINS